MIKLLDYLQIPDDYEANRLGLSWSASGDAVERSDGSTFALAQQIALFLEGYSSLGPLIHFSYILYLMEQFDAKRIEPDEPAPTRFRSAREPFDRSDALARAFRLAGSPYRNAGALCAWLCHDIPPTVDPPNPIELCLRLKHGSVALGLSVKKIATSPMYRPVELIPITALDFRTRLANALKQLSPEEIASWLDHGVAPRQSWGERVAETIEALKPRTLDGVLASLEERERLASALPLVAQFVSALSLPPRRLAHRALPTGGYADVATRGRPEQILPSQFAIDDIEFLRRFAENELLFFHREEPNTPLSEELVILLDQGVRTWGKVRPALAASALALAKLSGRKKLRLLLTSTGVSGELIDPLAIETEESTLGELWEASDLTPHPGEALERVLETPGTGRRDVIVLSHPRNVADPEFADATRRLDASTRLFTVTIDEPGSVQFREWRRGAPLKVADFRVDFHPPAVLRKGTPPNPAIDPRGWRGDVEPVPFPFRIGVTHRIERPLFDFDYSGRWLLLCTHRGLLHAWKIDGSAAEVLPRAIVDGSVVEQVDAVLGVADGFVVGGRVGKSLVAIHYDFASRTARAYNLGPNLGGEWIWAYSRELHSIVARWKDDCRDLDLSTRQVHRSGELRATHTTRAIRAFEVASSLELPPPRLPVVDDGSPEPERGGFVRFQRSIGEIRIERVSPAWPPFIPQSDGRPVLKDRWIDLAQWRGNVLALVVSDPVRGLLLRLFQTHLPGDGGAPLVATRELGPSSSEPSSMILSHDGRLLARRLGERQVEVRETTGAGQPIFVTVKGKTHTDPKVKLGRYGMLIHVGKHISLLRWDRDKLTVSTVDEGSTRSEIDVVTWPLDRPTTRSTPLPKVLEYDPHRFVACARAELIAVVDVFGQVSLFDRSERLIAMFIAFRSQVAAWTPDGTRFGSSQGSTPLLDGPATRNAAEIIGRALKQASDAQPRPADPLKEASRR